MSVSLEELAKATGAELQGDGALEIHGLKTLEHAGDGDICFINKKKYLPLLEKTTASAVILPPEMAQDFSGNRLVHDDPYYVYAIISRMFSAYAVPEIGIHETAVIHPDVELGEGVSIGANAVIEQGVVIGNNTVVRAGSFIGIGSVLGESCEIRPNVTIEAKTRIGDRCIIHSGVVIGDDGFGFAPYGGEWQRIEQIGNAVLGNDVEIGSNTTIDRAAINSTIIGNGVKIDNLVQIAHNVEIGDHTAIAACTGIAGSTKIGAHCVIAGATGIAGHLEIADRVQISAMSRVSRSLTAEGASYSSGTNITETALWRRNAVRFTQLDKMAKRISELEKQLDQLSKQTGRE